jgi:TolB-like protein/Flp pilus assembly protein TadD
MMQDDEGATVETLTKYRAIFSDFASRHEGRIVDSPGDNILAEFDSPVEAVQCAVGIERELGRRNLQLADHRQMRFRIGINLGDILCREDGTIYGDGVNVAARLESLAEPGGITVSSTVVDHAENKLPVTFEFAGEHAVKNIAKPVLTYRVNAEGMSAAAANPDKPLTLPDKPSIAILPFANLSGDHDKDYFADGIAVDLITALSRIRWMFVTASNSCFAYKGQSPDVRQVGQELGVRYVLEGSVRTGGNRLRVNAQLADATTGKQIWAKRFDRELVDLFDLQDEITETLVAALQAEVGEFERELAHRKPPENLDAWASYQRGMWHVWRMNQPDELFEASRLFERAIDLDPDFAQSHALLAYALIAQIFLSFVDSPEDTLERALKYANKAVELDDQEPMAHLALGRIYMVRGEAETALQEHRTAIDLDPSLAFAHFGLGRVLFTTGQFTEAVRVLDTAIRQSPRDPLAWAFLGFRCLAKMNVSDYEGALDDARRAVRQPNASFHVHAILASALAHLGRQEEARAALERLLEIKPDISPMHWLTAIYPLNPNAARRLIEPLVDGLRKAGLDIVGY